MLEAKKCELLKVMRGEYIKAILEAGAVKIAPTLGERFKLRSGGLSWIYVDHGDMLCQPSTEKPFIDAIGTLIECAFPQDKVVLVNLASKASPHETGAVAYRNGLRQIIISPDEVAQAEKGTNRRVRLPHQMSDDDILVVVDDVLTKGGTLKEGLVIVKDALRERFGEKADMFPIHLVVGMSRASTETLEMLKRQGIEVISLASIEEIIISTWSSFSAEQQSGLLSEFPKLNEMIPK
ncbi:hypothetical protein HZC27_00915 [Candidatus Roizmanbacteria bacterium]|nr:hypothetical protein [Candidatus Roizmanbacteria bacterium]